MHKTVIVVSAVGLSCVALGQIKPSPPLSAAVAGGTYADEAAVVEREQVIYEYAVDGTGSKLDTGVIRVQSSAALQGLAVLSFPYASGTQRLDFVYVRVRKPNGSVVETPVTDAQDQPAQVTQIAPMYSDLHLKQLPVRSLAVGDKLEFQLRTTQQKAEIPSEFWGQESFGTGAIFLERSVELRIPKEKKVNVFSPKNKPEMSEAAGDRIYRWTGSQLRSPTAKSDDELPPDTKPPIAWTTFPSWDALGVWYRGLIAGRDAVTPALQAKADELTAHATANSDKVRALYEYVSTHNHYVGIDFGVGRYQPHFAAEVMTNQYGDCKDKHTLLAALLEAEKFKVSAVLIGAGIEMNKDVPMPSAFNHVITQVDVDGKTVWLDATTEVAPYRVLVSALRDKDALVVPPAGSPHLEKTPADLPFPAVSHVEIKSELDKTGSLTGQVDVTLRGDDEILMRMATRQVARTQWDQLSQAYFEGTGWTGTTSGTVIDGGDDLSVPWHFHYNVANSSFGDWPNYRIGSLLPNAGLLTIDEKKPPTKEIELGEPHVQTAWSTIHLPTGYGAELPNAVHLKTPFATIDKAYELKEGSLVSSLRVETLVRKLPAAGWREYKKFVDDIGPDPWIQLTSKGSILGEKGPPPAGENNPVAAELVRQIHKLITVKDYDTALVKSKQAEAVNDKQAFLWSQRGYVAAMRHSWSEAADDYEREIREHPEEWDQYPALIQAQGFSGRKEAQHQALLAYAKVAPTKDSVILFSGNQLLALGNVEDAVAVYRAGEAAIPGNKMIQVQLASALYRAGQSGEATSVIRTALTDCSDPDVLNDGAYVLTGSKTLLPLAETSAKKAVDLLEAEMNETPLTGTNARSFRRTQLLLAAWDTLGWVYFKEEKNELAEEYVKASWKSGTHAEVGLHFGQILEKKGEKIGAMKVYEMAQSRSPNVLSPVSKELYERVSELNKEKVAPQYDHADRILQSQRTFHVPRREDLKGSGIFLMKISSMKVEKMELLSGDESLRGEGEALALLDFGLDVPKASHAQLLRSGVLFCSTQPDCEYVLTPPETADVK